MNIPSLRAKKFARAETFVFYPRNQKCWILDSNKVGQALKTFFPHNEINFQPPKCGTMVVTHTHICNCNVIYYDDKCAPRASW